MNGTALPPVVQRSASGTRDRSHRRDEETTAVKKPHPRALVAWWKGMSRRGAAVTSLVLALVCVLTGVAGRELALADPARTAGRPIDAAMAQTLSLAALSCPALSGPRLAGQVMANSGFEPGAAGVAALPAETFKTWAPWPRAEPRDTAASVHALAHHMCDLVGQVRQAGVGGDRWRAALAAYRSGTDAVKAAAGVPAGAARYVDLVAGYTAWYADQAVFGGAAVASAAAPAPPEAVPAQYLPAVRAAGSVCAPVTPARIAAQLMAASGFDPNLRSADGAMGIAQFRTDAWAEYAPPAGSPWDPVAAVGVLGYAMCDLVATFAPMGGDSYRYALAAFRLGADAVRAAGGVPPVPPAVAFVDRATALVDFYAGVGRAAPAASPSPSPTPSASPRSPKPTAPPARPSRTSSPSPAGPTRYKLLNVHSGKAMTVPNRSKSPNEIIVQQPDNGDPGQRWLLVKERDGTVRVKSAYNGMVLSPLDGSTEPYAFVAQVPDASSPATRWRLEDIGGGLYQFHNTGSGLLLALQYMVDTDGTRLFQHPDNGTVDHLWRLVPVR
ncbi:RICIN domain-containing protein [Phytohabitans sp. ZYX-F-186]|uniref:RICIN domain-containing protein n=1 Tax=Phytohabitans maris TaxID=3071409 RepID=A0ABU0ZF93_9ACTN|nr:RICIN domain-containing protein [Phytohabitans sp. ZYX-F-186]MDQ7905726.1 RICIN domain-containing protein [Phytohabitans sp. ZYX-F-186]